MEFILDWGNFLYLLEGAYYTVTITLASMFFGLLIGVSTAVIRLWGNRGLRSIVRVYVSVIRGTPMLVQIFIIYYGLSDFGINLDPVPSAIIALSIGVGAYLSEAIRGAILSVPQGQMEAGLTLQMSSWQTIRRIILPQAARIAIPPVGNEFISMLKETSLLSAITVTELTRSAQLLGSQHAVILPFLLMIAGMYWIISFVISSALQYIEKRLSKAY